MSYCRWSTNSFGCDIYAYESDFGFMIHVASRRYNGEVPVTDWDLVRDGKVKEYADQRRKQSAYLKKCGTRPIGLPYDGETFCEPSLEMFLERMIELKSVGYRFPDDVIDSIKEEILQSSSGL